MELTDAAAALESLGNETRLKLFRTLVRAGPGGLAVGELRERLQIPGSTLSHHVSHLISAGLLAQAREGRVLRCTARFATMQSLIAYLTEECCAEMDGGDC
ncbi:MAG: metalloregulator ArsR/SmtB family transcription factor [Pseudomonadota bacterium]